MRFHHSTRRGRSRLAHSSQGSGAMASRNSGPVGLHLGGRWAKLGYCRETNIHFNRRLPVAPPDAPSASKSTSRATSPALDADLLLEGKQINDCLNKLTLRTADDTAKTEANKLARYSKKGHAKPAIQQADVESFRQRLLAQVEKHPFWSNRAARRMQLTKVEERRIYIYELVSYCQRRDLEWRYEPYKAGLVTGSMPYKCIEPTLVGSDQMSAPDKASAMSRRNSLCRTSSSVYSATSSESPSHRAHTQLNRAGSTGGSLVSTPVHLRAGSMMNPVSQNSLVERPIASAELVWSTEPTNLIQPAPFTGHSHSCEIPQSSFVKRCHGCSGRGRIKCSTCYGVGYEVCLSCSGKGTTKALRGINSSSVSASDSYRRGGSDNSAAGDCDQDQWTRDSSSRLNQESGWSGSSAWSSTTESCHFCRGTGQKRCWVCTGKSYNHCSACGGAGRLRCYLNLNITWLNHRDESILNNADNIIPRDRLRLCSGIQLVDESGEPRLSPLDRERLDGATMRLEELDQLQVASKRLCEKHRSAYRDERFLKQRHRVTQIECHVVNYEWKQRSGHFVIYGDERKVYIAKYPFKTFCNIT